MSSGNTVESSNNLDDDVDVVVCRWKVDANGNVDDIGHCVVGRWLRTDEVGLVGLREISLCAGICKLDVEVDE